MDIDIDKPIKFFMYCRKSSEGEDRQTASLGSQKKELMEIVEKDDLKVVKVYEESQSAHHKGRPIFDKMLKEIIQGKANGLLVWNLNRVSRNSRDASDVIELMDEGYLQEIRTKNVTYRNNSDDKANIGQDLVMSKKYSDSLSEVVKRGNKEKFFERREWSGVAKPGYMNLFDPITRKSSIAVDQERFNLLKQSAKLVLSGTHTVGQAWYKLNKEWGYRTRQMHTEGGKELARATFYRFLSDPFYYGLMVRKEGQVMGRHTPMFTKDEFDLLQIRLGRKGKPHRTDHEYPYKSVLKCGECGGAITAQEKWQIICPFCKKKFHKGKLTDSCPKCHIKIEDMTNPKVLHYIYYGCTKQIHPNCTQKDIEIRNLEKTIDEELTKFEIPKEFTDWAIKYLNEVNVVTENDQNEVAKHLHNQYEGCLLQIQSLLNLKTRPDNADGSLLSEEEYATQRKQLMEQKETIATQMKKADESVNNWVSLTEETFKFACYARYWFANGDAKTRTMVLSKLGNNLVIKDRKLQIDQSQAFFLIEKGYNGIKEVAHSLEPNKEIVTPIQMLSLEPICTTWRRGRDSNSRRACALSSFQDYRTRPTMRPLLNNFLRY